jgi:hypothetical protein
VGIVHFEVDSDEVDVVRYPERDVADHLVAQAWTIDYHIIRAFVPARAEEQRRDDQRTGSASSRQIRTGQKIADHWLRVSAAYPLPTSSI